MFAIGTCSAPPSIADGASIETGQQIFAAKTEDELSNRHPEFYLGLRPVLRYR
jgi:hypothetical protein